MTVVLSPDQGQVDRFHAQAPFGTAPVILGLILGPIAEANLRRGLQAFQGDWTPFFTRPISLTFLVIAVGLLALTLWQNYRGNRRSESNASS